MEEFDEDLLGDASAEGDRRVRGAVPDEERPPENGPAVELDDVVFVEAQGHQAAPDVFPPGKADDTQGGVVGCFKEAHGRAFDTVYPIFYRNQENSPVRGNNPYWNYRIVGLGSKGGRPGRKDTIPRPVMVHAQGILEALLRIYDAKSLLDKILAKK
jgi:hypothetical protein